MHQLNVLALGPDSFIATLNELKSYLKFNFSSDISKLNNNSKQNFNVLLFHIKILENQQIKNIIDKSDLIKILLLDNNIKLHNYDISLKLPTTLKEINSVIENSAARKIFSSNSCIKIKDFLLDKNEKKLIKGDNFIILTEKEIQLLELFLITKKSISKSKILSLVWKYSSDADTHTVETHVYRLRKKVNKIFFDDQFILNNKEGYYL